MLLQKICVFESVFSESNPLFVEFTDFSRRTHKVAVISIAYNDGKNW